MKWVRVRNPRSSKVLLGRDRTSFGNLNSKQKQRLETLQAKMDACFKEFTPDDFKKNRKEFDVWADYTFDAFFEKEEQYEKFKERYEIFCGGFLYFYDEKNRSGLVDHAIYFEWSKFQRATVDTAEYRVAILMNPKPIMAKNKVSVPSKGGKLLKEISLTSSTTEDGAVDPPKPPPPPPPSME
ncbi:MAG: hypothetical protein WCF67_17295 [Chitinophagaceae bacterium]